MQVSRLFGTSRAHRGTCSIKPQVRAVAFWGVLGLSQKVYLLSFRQKTAMSKPPQRCTFVVVLAFAQMKPAKMNRSPGEEMALGENLVC